MKCVFYLTLWAPKQQNFTHFISHVILLQFQKSSAFSCCILSALTFTNCFDAHFISWVCFVQVFKIRTFSTCAEYLLENKHTIHGWTETNISVVIVLAVTDVISLYFGRNKQKKKLSTQRVDFQLHFKMYRTNWKNE